MNRPNIRAGRPAKDMVQALGDHVVEIADALFIEKGYGATSMATVASRARVGKQTLYRRYPNKAALFREVIRRRIDAMLVPPQEDPPGCDPLNYLKRMAVAALDTVLEPEFITLHRIVIAEALPFPELACAAADNWGSSFVGRCVAAIEHAQKLGRCRAGNPEAMAQCLLWSLVGQPFHKALTGEVTLTNAEERREHLEFGWRIFLEGVSLPIPPKAA
jgi:TetR/AcrR family transcriptional regulator of autoinduction and epiphytic fitness